MGTAPPGLGKLSHVVRCPRSCAPSTLPLGIGSLRAVNRQRAFADAAVGPSADAVLRDGATAPALTALDVANR